MSFNSSGGPSAHEDGNYALSLSQGLAVFTSQRAILLLFSTKWTSSKWGPSPH